MAHYEGKRYGCSCPDGTCDMNCRMYRIAAGKPSNADRIRGMTDEELAEWMANKVDCQYCSVRSEWCSESEASCRTNWLDWLKEEAVSDG